MLIMQLVDMPANALRVNGISPREENKKRLLKVHAFVEHAEARQPLRRLSLVFQLTGGVEALVSRLPRDNEPPPLIR